MKSLTILICSVFLFTMISWGQHFHWKDFTNTKMNGEVLTHLNNTEEVGSAVSQEIIHNAFQWNATYTYVPSSTSRVFGILADGEPPSLANMTAGYHISKEGTATVFFNGKSIAETVLEEGDLLTFEKGTEELYFKKNKESFFNVTFSNSNSYRLMATLNIKSSFDRIAFTHDYQPTMVAEFDTITQRGTIEVSLPSDAPAGPYHYLIGSDDYINLAEVEQYLSDSTSFPIDSAGFQSKSSTYHKFENLQIGSYYVSVVNEQYQPLYQEEIHVHPEYEPISNTGLIKEGDLFVANSENARGDMIYGIKPNTSGGFSFKINDITSVQYYGFGLDDTLMTGPNDIKYGYLVADSEVFTIIEGVVSNEGTPVESGDVLTLKVEGTPDESMLTYLKDGEFIEESIILFQQNKDYNLKFQLNELNTYFEPVIIWFPILPGYFVDIDVAPLKCDEKTGDVQINFNYYGGWLYNFSHAYYTVSDEDGNLVPQFNPSSPTSISNLAPGVYTIQGTAVFTNTSWFFSNYYVPINETFIVGYRVSWINKVATVYDSQDESLSRQGNGGLSIGNMNYGYATSNNDLVGGESWVDFKIKPVKYSEQRLKWSVNPVNQYNNNLNTIMLQQPLANQVVLTNFWLSDILSLGSNDRFRISYSGNFIKFYKNQSNLIFQQPATSQNLERINAFLSNSNQMTFESEIYDVHTNMPCFIPELSYAKLQKELSSDYVLSENKELKVYFDEDYSHLQSENLAVKIYDFQRNEITVPNNEVYKYADNRYTLDLSSLSLVDEKFYTLEVTVNKDVKHFLKFKYKD